MPTVSDQLRQAREAKKLTVHQLADITKIRTDHIRALEEGNFNIFSAPVYIRGFIRTCATVLKLDVPEIMKALDAELSQTEKFSDPPPLTGQRRSPLDFIMLQISRLDWRSGLLGLGTVAGLIIVASILLSWRHRETTDPLKGLKPGIYQPAKSNAGETLPVPPPASKR